VDPAIERRLGDFVRDSIEREAASGWARLRRVPSTYTWTIIDYLLALEPVRRAALFAECVSGAAYFFEPDRPPTHAPHPELREMYDTLPRIFDWRYLSARHVHGIALNARAGRAQAWSDIPDEVIRRAGAIRPTTAGEIRKVVKRAFAERFDARCENFGAGTWKYFGRHGGRDFMVAIDYGGRIDQLRYEVEYDHAGTGLHPRRLCYEGLLEVGLGDWDYLTADNLEDSIALLCELVRELVEIPERVRG
jgi:hypothetical protein